MTNKDIQSFLDEKVEVYNQDSFIEDDPISIPHLLNTKEDIEIISLIVATIAWGNRKSIIKNSHKVLQLMANRPHDFTMNYDGSLINEDFVHRTFNTIDLDFFIRSLQNIYTQHGGLEKVFSKELDTKDQIMNFRQIFLDVPHEKRSEKHLANPEKGSSAKRINMFLRWMVRKDKKGVDFGLWSNHSQSKLYVPLDVHTGVSARKLGLIKRKQNDWKALEELMVNLRSFDPEDPCKYDFALFGLSANNEI
jgi:uncharacterized protein (TIGR02757 family)